VLLLQLHYPKKKSITSNLQASNLERADSVATTPNPGPVPEQVTLTMRRKTAAQNSTLNPPFIDERTSGVTTLDLDPAVLKELRTAQKHLFKGKLLLTKNHIIEVQK
jgi:hypothetical protein